MAIPPPKLPENPSGKQVWIIIKIASAQTELTNINAMLFRLREMEKDKTPYAPHEHGLADTIKLLENARENLQKYVDGLENEFAFN